MTAPPRPERYILKTGESAAARLRLLHDIYGPSTRTLLERAGLRPGMSAVDVGCGIGTVSSMMASQVTHDGSVVGVDASPDQLAVARESAFKAGLKNVEFVAGSAYRTGLPRATFDLAYCRFVLCHLQRPSDALREMLALLRPGGVLVCEDMQASTLASEPPTSVYADEARRVVEGGAKRGVDSDIGPKLPRYLRTLDCRDVDGSLQQPAFFRGERKRFWEYSLAEAAPVLVEEGILSDEQVAQRLEEMRRVNSDDEVLVMLPRVWQVWGRKPAADTRT